MSDLVDAINAFGTEMQPPADELAMAPIIDDWAVSLILATIYTTKAYNAVGRVAGSLKFANGQGIGTSAIAAIDTDRRWLCTKNTLYRLGFPQADDALIVRAATMDRNTTAFRFLAEVTGAHTLDGVMTEMLNDVAISITVGPPEAIRSDARAFAAALQVAGRIEAAQAWRLLAVDPLDRISCGEIKDALLSGHAFADGRSTALTMIEGWIQIAAGKYHGIGVDDPIWAAHHIGRISEHKDGEDALAAADVQIKIEVPAEGVIVIKAVGGSQDSWAGKPVVAEFKSITGKHIPLRAVLALAPARKALLAEFPYAERVIDTLLSDLSGCDEIYFRPTIIVGAPGSGKSRLVRRLGEVLGCYVGRYDGSGSGDNAIGGTARRWSTGEPCWPISVIRAAGISNPILHVDEIDKAAESQRNGSLAHALLPMLDIESSRRFADPYIQSDVDISHVSFLLTVNDDSELPAPLKDRLRVIRMPSMGPEHVGSVADCIVAEIAKERGGAGWHRPLDGDEIEIVRRLIGDGSIRRLRNIVEKLIEARDASAPRH